jgi:hypothetical protein
LEKAVDALQKLASVHLQEEKVRAPNVVNVQPAVDLKSVPAEQKTVLQPPMTAAIVEAKRDTAVPVSTQQQQLPSVTGVSATAAPDEKTAALPSSVPEQKQSGVVTAAKQKKKSAAVVDQLHYCPPKRPLRTGCQCKVPQSHKHLLTECPQFRSAYSVHKLAPAGWQTFGPRLPYSQERAKIEDVGSEVLKEVDLLVLHGVLHSACHKDYSDISNDLRLLGHGVLRALPQLFDPDCGECREIVATAGRGDHCQLMRKRLGIEPPQGPCPWRCSAAKDV